MWIGFARFLLMYFLAFGWAFLAGRVILSFFSYIKDFFIHLTNEVEAERLSLRQTRCGYW